MPAHNESAVINRSLRALTAGLSPDEAEVIVACNGCSDDTADRARAFGPPVRVVEIAPASKIAALNAGDAAALGYPRVYVDADVSLDAQSLRELAAALSGPTLAASPTMRMDLEGASWPVRAYYAVWQALPYTREGLMGTGVYALSRAGRERFGVFPDVIADDGYVRMLFKACERRRVESAVSVVTGPRTLADLIKIKTRSRFGLYQLRARDAALFEAERSEKRYVGALGVVARRPGLWAAAPWYLLVNLAARRNARARFGRSEPYRWQRDESSRAGVGGA